MAEQPPRDSESRLSSAGRRDLANAQRLAALGEAIDRKAGVATKKPRGGKRSTSRKLIITGVVVVGLIVALLGGGYLYAQLKFASIPKLSSAGEVHTLGNQPFNILEIGSDSRAGLTGAEAAMTGAGTAASPGGQRSDVVKIMHVDPVHQTIATLSIPRDTMMSLLKNQAKYGNYNRINVNFENGSALVAQTITANLGIPIAHTIAVSFGGLVNAASAIGGVRMYFPYPARDTYSGLRVRTAGCRTINTTMALALARSRHYEWYEHNQWNTDVTSDYGRIYRQNEFIKAFIAQAKTLWNPLTINNLLSALPQGISLDSNFTLNELIALAYRFHGISPNAMSYYTLPVVGGRSTLGDVLFINQPTAQQTLVKIFGSQLLRPTNPPPNTTGATPMPPVITIPKPAPTTTAKHTSTSGAVKHHKPATPVTTTTVVGDQWFDPVPC